MSLTRARSSVQGEHLDVNGVGVTRRLLGALWAGRSSARRCPVLAAEDVGDDQVFADPYLLRDFPANETTIVGLTGTVTRPVEALADR